MALKQRLKFAFIIVVILCSILGVGSLGSLFYIAKELLQVRVAAETTEVTSTQAARCIAGLQMQAAQYLTDPSEEKAKRVQEVSGHCREYIDRSSRTVAHSLGEVGFIDEKDVASYKSRIDGFVSTVLALGTRSRAARQSLSLIERRFRKLSEEPRARRFVRELDSLFSGVSFSISSKIVSASKFEASEIDSLRKQVEGLISRGGIPASVANDVEDAFADFEGVASIWNKSLDQTSGEYRSRVESMQTLPPEIVTRVISDLIGKSDRIRLFFVVSSLSVSLLMALALVVVGAIFIWIFQSWRSTIGRLRGFTEKAVKQENLTVEESRWGDEVCQSKSDDDLAVATRTLVLTLRELSELRSSLEKKVEERSLSLQQTQDKLVASEKLAALGTMAAGVAHELNNPLQIISFSAETLGARLHQDERATEKLARIHSSVKRMTKIIEQLKKLGRESTSTQEDWYQLKGIVENAVGLVQHRITDLGIAFSISHGPEDLLILCDEVKLESVLSNLIGNAADALEGIDDGRIRSIVLAVEPVALGWELRVTDNANGIPEEFQKKLFDPFFTTKDVGKGTGLGLSLCHRILAEMGGELKFSTVAGKGTVFSASIPQHRVRGGSMDVGEERSA